MKRKLISMTCYNISSRKAFEHILVSLIAHKNKILLKTRLIAVSHARINIIQIIYMFALCLAKFSIPIFIIIIYLHF